MRKLRNSANYVSNTQVFSFIYTCISGAYHKYTSLRDTVRPWIMPDDNPASWQRLAYIAWHSYLLNGLLQEFLNNPPETNYGVFQVLVMDAGLHIGEATISFQYDELFMSLNTIRLATAAYAIVTGDATLSVAQNLFELTHYIYRDIHWARVQKRQQQDTESEVSKTTLPKSKQS